ncbi:MAG: hypothetical protein L3J29_13115 [Cyclobacteriaceae bacterium]|nr:hypothetical protein [Cyclobacteriaceae bacterium]
MIKTVITLLLLAGVFNLQAQNNELDERNGFKHIKLLTKATSYPELKLDKTIDEFNSIYTRRTGHLLSIGEIPIKNMTLYTYKDLIFKIEIVTAKDPQLFKGLEQAFGKAKFSVTSNNYIWQGTNVKLSFKGSKGGKGTIMTYSSLKIKDIIKKDEEQKIKDLSNDF